MKDKDQEYKMIIDRFGYGKEEFERISDQIKHELEEKKFQRKRKKEKR